MQPAFTDAQRNLAQTLILIGKPESALSVLRLTVRSEPDDWKGWMLMAQAHSKAGQDGQARTCADKAIERAPRSGSALHLRSGILLRLGLIPDAITDLEAALAINPDDVIALTNLSVPLARQGRTQAALEVVERAVAIDPENLVARFRLATQLVEMGQADKAVAAYREVLNRAPDHPATLERLAELLPADGRANLESNIRSALKKVAKPSEDRASLFFALAKVMEATGNSTEMRRSLARANDEMRRLSPYDPVADDRITRRILARYPSEMAVSTETQDGPFPIFILGLPRSGTTLAEAILGRHPDITPLGEQGTLGFLVQDIINNDLPFTDMDAVRLRLEERRLLPDMPEGTRAYTDKMLENYRIIGMLRQVHPQARIIHITRDPRDVALSMWKSHLSGTALSYTFDLTAMAAKFNLYAETMAHWHHVLPGQILNLPYADMVGDVVAASHRIADFCGVDWVEPMSRPDQATAQIMTASATQLRRPVHTQSVGKWQQEASLLVPFTEALDPVYWGDFIA